MKTPTTFKFHPDLKQALQMRAQQLGYPSISALITALCRADLYQQADHGKARKWARLPWAKQDQVDMELLVHVTRRKRPPGAVEPAEVPQASMTAGRPKVAKTPPTRAAVILTSP